jgi:tetratricopeptide (TPR) repeat protein
MNTPRFALAFCILIGSISFAQGAEPPANENLLLRERDASEAKALTMAALGVAQIEFAKFSGDAETANALLKSNYDEVESVLQRNPESLTGLLLRGQYKNIAKENSGIPDFEQLIAVSSKRITTDPTYSQIYSFRADAYRELGKWAEAKDDYLKAIEYEKDPKKIESLKNDIALLDKLAGKRKSPD